MPLIRTVQWDQACHYSDVLAIGSVYANMVPPRQRINLRY